MNIDSKNTNSTLNVDQLHLLKNSKLDSQIIEHYRAQQSIYLPKLATIDTYDKLIEYVSEMYTYGMILGDEFVMRPDDDQKGKLTTSVWMMCENGNEYAKYWQDDGFVINTPFGVKIIIK